MSWPFVAFVDVCNIQGGTQPPKSTFVDQQQDGYVRLLQIQDFKRSDKAVYVPDKKNLKKCNSDDILIGRYGASVGKILTGLAGAYNVAMVKVIADQNKIDVKYLYYYLISPFFQTYILNVGSRAAQAGFNKDDLSGLQIPLPPLAEQKRIAAILDKADAIRRKRQQAIQLADQFLHSVFLDMFGDPVTNPKGWEVKPLLNGIESIISGWSAKGESYPSKIGELGVLKISAVTSGKFKPEENKFVHNTDIPEGKRLVFPKKGDLLFSRANTRELVAATCIVPSDESRGFLPDKLWKVTTKPKEVLPEFLHYLIWQPRFKEILTSQATGTSGSMLNISKAKFINTEAIFPPTVLQERFKSIYWKTQEILDHLDNSFVICSDAFHALCQKTFSGQL